MKFLLAIAETHKFKDCKKKGGVIALRYLWPLTFPAMERLLLQASLVLKMGKKYISGKCSPEGSSPLLKYRVPKAAPSKMKALHLGYKVFLDPGSVTNGLFKQLSRAQNC